MIMKIKLIPKLKILIGRITNNIIITKQKIINLNKILTFIPNIISKKMILKIIQINYSKNKKSIILNQNKIIQKPNKIP